MLLVLNGPGFASASGTGSEASGATLADIRRDCESLCESLHLALDFRQTEDAQELLRWMTTDGRHCDALVINPAAQPARDQWPGDAYRSALASVANLKRPLIEVRLGNIFRHGRTDAQPPHDAVAGLGLICGLGGDGYLLAIRSIARSLDRR